MAAADSSGSVDIVHKITHGQKWHIFTFGFTLKKTNIEQNFKFQYDFQTDCPTNPSTWWCKMRFRKVSENGKADIAITLKRTDSAENAVLVNLTPDIQDFGGKHLFISQKLERHVMCGGEEIEEILAEFLPLQSQREYFNRRLHVYLVVYISSCHEEHP